MKNLRIEELYPDTCPLYQVRRDYTEKESELWRGAGRSQAEIDRGLLMGSFYSKELAEQYAELLKMNAIKGKIVAVLEQCKSYVSDPHSINIEEWKSLYGDLSNFIDSLKNEES